MTAPLPPLNAKSKPTALTPAAPLTQSFFNHERIIP